PLPGAARRMGRRAVRILRAARRRPRRRRLVAGDHRSGPLRVLGPGRSGRDARPDRVRAMTAARIPSPRDPDARVLYLTREGSHLCDEALPVVQAEADRVGSTVEVRDIDEDPALQADWDYDVPVII